MSSLVLPITATLSSGTAVAFTIKGGSNTAILGTSHDGPGVAGESQAGNGVAGISQTGNGVLGSVSPTNLQGVGVLGLSLSGGNGVKGQTNSSFEPGAAANAGVWGNNTSSGPGVKGTSTSGDAIIGISTSNSHAGVSAVNDSGGFGIWARGSPAGHFEGDLQVTGKITAGDFTGALVTCLNGLKAIGDFSVIGNATIKGNVTTGDVFLTGGDCAEQFDIAGTQPLAPGTVVVIDREGTLRESQQPYDKKVAGVISGAGGYRPGIILDRRPSAEERTTVALVGKVFCKVDAQYAPIEVGDLLTTSPTAGHAMKADDRGSAFGAVIGKALQSLEAGQALIPILVALQ
jgi:hypothetical protein